MSTDVSLLDLYRQAVLDHSRQPHNFRRPEHADRVAEGHNPLCGDKVRVYVLLEGTTLRDTAFEATGCAISLASASMMTDAMSGQSIDGARRLIDGFVSALTPSPAGADVPANAVLEGELAALGSVRAYPSRVRCATLPWRALRAALDSDPTTVTTE